MLAVPTNPKVSRQPRMRAAVHFLLLAFALCHGGGAASAKSLHRDYVLKRGHVQAYGNWLAGCDNLANCTLLGFPEPLAAIDGDSAGEGWALRFTFAAEDGDAPVAQWVPLPGGAPSMLPADEAEPLFRLLKSGQSAVDPVRKARIPAGEFPRALKAIRQRRVELRARATSSRPMLRKAAVPEIVSGIDPLLTENRCGPGGLRDLRRFRLAGGEQLWSYKCGLEGADQRSYWAMSAHAASNPVPLILPNPGAPGIKAGEEGLPDATFDFDFGTLRSFDHPDSREDCGVLRVWGFTGRGWQLVHRGEMPVCRGLEPPEWIRTHVMPSHPEGHDD